MWDMSSRKRYGKFGPIVGAIDEGTFSTRFMAFAAETSEVLTYHQVEIPQTYPKVGWVEQDPILILNAVEECIEKTIENLIKLEIDPRDMVAIGIANQRETTILWDKITGEPFHNAIVWMDSRTSVLVDELIKNGRKTDVLKSLCGLPLNSYFSALKIKWLINNIPDVRLAIEENRCLFGTVDSWLIWNLTGGSECGIHVTDVTNASRTMLMNLSTLQWDHYLLTYFSIPQSILPEICSSSEIYGYIRKGVLTGVPISGCLGDQQSALFGQLCLKEGQIKNAYGTGCFLLCNTGRLIIESRHGLLTTVAYKLGPDAPAIYALEGAISGAAAAFKWLRDNLSIFSESGDADNLVLDLKKNSDVTFVPAFPGLYAPYWEKNASSLICGLNENTKSEDLIYAAMESVCFQTKDVLDALHRDYPVPVSKLLVDGSLTVSSTLMQIQADILGIPIVRSSIAETTALGAAIVAGMAKGIEVWDTRTNPKVFCDIFFPTITQDEIDVRYRRWKMAISRSIGWSNKTEATSGSNIQGAVAPGIFILLSLATLIIAKTLNS